MANKFDGLEELLLRQSQMYDRALLERAPYQIHYGPMPEPKPRPKPLMVWQRFFCAWLIDGLEDMVQEIHDWANGLGAYCSCDCGEY